MRFLVHSAPAFTQSDLEKLFITPDDIKSNPTPLRSIIKEVLSRGCKTVVQEMEYVDTDFLSEYENFYAKAFRKIKKYCTRLHFFTAQLSQSDLFKLNEEPFKSSYLGFCVLRPTNIFRVGRTVLVPPASHDDFFILCKAPLHSHIMGTKFVTEAMPFTQQDTSVGACAHACLWMTSLYMHKKHMLPKFLPFQLTEFATRSLSFGSIMPNRKGIKDIQMLEALRLAGMQCVLETFSFDISEKYLTNRSNQPELKDKVRKVKKFVYSYLESELPVILNLKFPGSNLGHAVVVVGHTFNRNASPEKFTIEGVNYLSNVSWVPNFIIHNDNSGPYLPILDHSDISTEISLDKVMSAIAILPPEVSAFAEEVEANAIMMVKLWLEGDTLKPDDLVFRTYLRSSNDFLNELVEKKRDMPEELMVHYRQLPMPKYIWITEISKQEYINQSSRLERKVIGDFLTDSTANPWEREKAFLAMRLRENLLLQNYEAEGWDHIILKTAFLYAGLART